MMKHYVDLHLHSTFSDGLLTPTELVEEAAKRGLQAIALADHDNIDGVPEATKAGSNLDVEILTGVELSVVWNDYQDLHLLGYDFDHTDQNLTSALSEFRDFRLTRIRKILDNVNERLIKQGRLPLAEDHLRVHAGGTIGRPHIGQALLAAGYVHNMEQAFIDYLVPCNVTKRYFPINEAIDLLHSAGGCAVLAHPPFIGINGTGLREMLNIFKGFGLDGLEAYHAGTDNNGIDHFITLARQMGLIVTGGSDFHQQETGGVSIGVGRGNLKIPYQCVEEVRNVAARYKNISI